MPSIPSLQAAISALTEVASRSAAFAALSAFGRSTLTRRRLAAHSPFKEGWEQCSTEPRHGNHVTARGLASELYRERTSGLLNVAAPADRRTK